jgi:hypothetical protein
MRVAVVIGNPGHHTAMLLPVMRELRRRQHEVEVLSICDFRGLPPPAVDVPGVPIRALFPAGIRRSLSDGAQSGRSADGIVRALAQSAVWKTTMGPKLRWLVRRPVGERYDVAILPNDVAYPYDRIRRRFERAGIPTILVQEGIRFPLPHEKKTGAAYGAGGCARVCCWGQASAAHFASLGVPSGVLSVTGCARFDDLDVEGFRARAAETRAAHGLSERSILYLSNPIDDQGFCSTDEKMRLFGRFIEENGPALAENDSQLAVKLHPRESIAAFRQVAARSAHAGRIQVLEGVAIHALLACGQAAVVLSSTVGLEAMLFDLPLGVVSLPGYGTVHDYVAAGAAVPLAGAGAVRALLEPRASSAEHRRRYVDAHLANRGMAASAIADTVIEVGRSKRSAA